MSPFSNSYSSLEEAWGMDNFPTGYPNPKKTKKQKKPRDPICELYEMGSSPSRAYNELDVMNVVNQPSRMQSREPELADTIEVEPQPEPPKRASVITKPASQQRPQPQPQPFDEDEEDDMSEFIGYIDKKVHAQRESAARVILPYADIGLYMISGVLLIFMMEQFIKIGMMMRSY